MNNEQSAQHTEEDKKKVVHELKTWPPFYEAVATERKTFEVRKFDRDYKEGDILHLKEWRPFYPVGEQPYSGRETFKTITYVLRGGEFGIQEGYCVLGLESGWKAIAESNRDSSDRNCKSIWVMSEEIKKLNERIAELEAKEEKEEWISELKKALLNFDEACEENREYGGWYHYTELVDFIETTFRQFTPPKQAELGMCKERGCNSPATKDYNGYQYYVCDYHYNKLNNEFDQEYK